MQGDHYSSDASTFDGRQEYVSIQGDNTDAACALSYALPQLFPET